MKINDALQAAEAAFEPIHWPLTISSPLRAWMATHIKDDDPDAVSDAKDGAIIARRRVWCHD